MQDQQNKTRPFDFGHERPILSLRLHGVDTVSKIEKVKRKGRLWLQSEATARTGRCLQASAANVDGTGTLGTTIKYFCQKLSSLLDKLFAYWMMFTSLLLCLF